MQPGTMNHIVEKDNKIIIIKNVPALVCGQCGEGNVDYTHALKLEELVQRSRMLGMEVLILNYPDVAA